MNQAVNCCPVCSSSDVRTIGPILHPPRPLVAGVELDLGDTEYRLRGCRSCEFEFKDPPFPAEQLKACYVNADSSNWQTDPDPWERRFDLLKDLLEKLSPGRRVLDVGCFNGAMLKYLGEGWQKFGVELSKKAAELARARNVEIVAPDLDRMDGGLPLFDAVLAIDVAEHVQDPVAFFRQLSAVVRPGGIVMIGTGNNQSFAWRLQGGTYWYCSLPEHVSFYSRKTLDKIGELTGMKGIEYRQLSHKRVSLRRWVIDAVKTTGYIGGRAVGGFGIPALRRLFVERRGPSIQAAHDHLIYVYRKN